MDIKNSKVNFKQIIHPDGTCVSKSSSRNTSLTVTLPSARTIEGIIYDILVRLAIWLMSQFPF